MGAAAKRPPPFLLIYRIEDFEMGQIYDMVVPPFSGALKGTKTDHILVGARKILATFKGALNLRSIQYLDLH